MSGTGVIECEGREIALDADGHLIDCSDWSRSLADTMASQDGLTLTDDHWWLIDFVRNHHARYGTPPLIRVAIGALRQARADPTITSRALYRLFNDNPIREACRLAGYPKPDWCI